MALRAVLFTLPLAGAATLVIGALNGLGVLGHLVLYSALGQLLLVMMLGGLAMARADQPWRIRR